MPDTPTKRQQIRVSKEWLRLLETLAPAAGRLLLLGGADSGKTTLARWLTAKLSAQGPTALVDADVGQSQVGPPACVGWRLASSRDYEFHFVGDVSPATCPATALAATFRAVTRAEAAGARAVVIDTTGYVSGPGALALKTAKVEVLAPLQVVALGDSPDIRRLLAAWRNDDRLVIHRLPVAQVIRQKTRGERRDWRRKLFAARLAEADLRTIPLRGLSLTALPTVAELRNLGLGWADLEGLLLCFHDAERRGLCLGLLKTMDLHAHQMLVRAPEAAAQAAGVIFGMMRLQPDGAELSRPFAACAEKGEADNAQTDGS